MMQQFEEDPFNGNRGEKSSNPNELTALQVLKLRLGLENSPNLNAPLRSQEDAIRNLSHQDWTIRLEAVRMLSNLKNQCLIVKAEELINDENVAIREAMAEALGRLGGEASIALLLKCLEDKDWSVRATAFQSLGKLGDIVPLEPLVEGLRDEDVSVRLAALKALEKHATRVPLETFVSTSKDKDSCIRMAGTRVIERLLEHPEQCLLSNKTIEVLIEEIRNEKSEERLRALEFLGKLAVYALTKSSSIEKEKAESVAEKLSSNEEQENHNFTALFLPTNTVIHPGYMDPFPANLYDFMIGRFLKTTRTFPAFGRGCLIQACKSAQLYKVMGTSIPQRGEPLKFFLEQIMWYTKPNPLDYTICSYVSLDNPERFQILKRFTTAFPDAKKMPFRMIVLFVLLGLPLPTKWSYPTFYSQLRELLLSYQKEPPFLMEFMRGADSLPSLSKTGDTSRLSIVTMDSSLGLRENMDELMQKSRKENGSLIYAPLDLYQGVR